MRMLLLVAAVPLWPSVVSKKSVQLPNQRADWDLVHDEDGFAMRHEKEDHRIPRWNVDPKLRVVTPEGLKKFLAIGYLRVKEAENKEHDYSVQGMVRGEGGWFNTDIIDGAALVGYGATKSFLLALPVLFVGKAIKARFAPVQETCQNYIDNYEANPPMQPVFKDHRGNAISPEEFAARKAGMGTYTEGLPPEMLAKSIPNPQLATTDPMVFFPYKTPPSIPEILAQNRNPIQPVASIAAVVAAPIMMSAPRTTTSVIGYYLAHGIWGATKLYTDVYRPAIAFGKAPLMHNSSRMAASVVTATFSAKVASASASVITPSTTTTLTSIGMPIAAVGSAYMTFVEVCATGVWTAIQFYGRAQTGKIL